MSIPGAKDENELTSVAIRRTTKEKLDKIGGTAPSYDKTIDGMADVIARERLVEKVRRKILGVSEDAVGRITRGDTAKPDPSERLRGGQ